MTTLNKIIFGLSTAFLMTLPAMADGGVAVQNPVPVPAPLALLALGLAAVAFISRKKS